jgi:histidine ammonia-lyase
MAMGAAHNARQVLENAERIVAIELLTAAQGVDFRREQVGAEARLGPGTAAAYAQIRERVPFLEHDAPLAPMIAAVGALVADGTLVQAVDAAL